MEIGSNLLMGCKIQSSLENSYRIVVNWGLNVKRKNMIVVDGSKNRVGGVASVLLWRRKKKIGRKVRGKGNTGHLGSCFLLTVLE